MAELVDGTRATGQNAFRAGQPTQTTTASASTSYEPVIDPALLDMSYEGASLSDEEMDHDISQVTEIHPSTPLAPLTTA